MLQIWPVPVFADNYVWILERDGSKRVAVVDPGESEAVVNALDRRGLEVGAVLVTHHHADHIGGLGDIIRRYRPDVHGRSGDAIAGLDHPVADGDAVTLTDLDLKLAVLDLPGHTAKHIGYTGAEIAFVGDTLFAGGCGRVFEGTHEEMHRSLSRLAALPGRTKVYCAHEYTVANLKFGRLVEPGNTRLVDRLAAAEAARSAGQPTVPSTIGYELETNVFLRCTEPEVVASAESRAGRTLDGAAEVFGVLRSWKDGWSG